MRLLINIPHKIVNYLMNTVKVLINKLLLLFNLKIVKSSSLTRINNEILKEPIVEKEFKILVNQIKKLYGDEHSPLALYSVYTSCKYLYENKIQGDIVEVGVYKGVNVAMAILYFSSKRDFSRNIYLYDTFEGMTDPGINDFGLLNKKILKKGDNYASKKMVFEKLSQIEYDQKKIYLIKGDVRNTLKYSKHDKIAFLRQDTDFYDSTLTTLNFLYDSVIKDGIIIYDDYGHWQGQFDAVNEFHELRKSSPLLIRTSRKERLEFKFN